MPDRQTLVLVGLLVVLSALGALSLFARSGTPPPPCGHPALDIVDGDLLRCDGKGGAAGPRGWLAGHKLDVNAATAAQLRRLPRVGEGLANTIVETRIERGGFQSLDELVEVKGLGPKTLQRIRPLISVAP